MNLATNTFWGGKSGGCGCGRYGGGEPGGVASSGSPVAALMTGMAGVQRIRAAVGLMIGVAIALVLIYIGASKLLDPHTEEVVVTFTRVSNCNQLDPKKVSTQKGNTRECLVDVAYSVAGVRHAASRVSAQTLTQPKIGGTGLFYYDPNNPSSVQGNRPGGAGWVGVGLLVGVVSAGIAAFKFKMAAIMLAAGPVATALVGPP